jgi:hypothetical protein
VVCHAVFGFSFSLFCMFEMSLLLETTGRSYAVSRALALYQLTHLVVPVHTNFYHTAVRMSKVLSPVLPLSDISAVPSRHVIIDNVLSEAPHH